MPMSDCINLTLLTSIISIISGGHTYELVAVPMTIAPMSVIVVEFRIQWHLFRVLDFMDTSRKASNCVQEQWFRLFTDHGERC